MDTQLKINMYLAGAYRIPVPPVVHASCWTIRDWINFIDIHGVWTFIGCEVFNAFRHNHMGCQKGVIVGQENGCNGGPIVEFTNPDRRVMMKASDLVILVDDRFRRLDFIDNQICFTEH